MAEWQQMYPPLELEDGTLVCSRHEKVVCPVCCVDYSFALSDAQILPNGTLICRDHRRVFCHDCCVDYRPTPSVSEEEREQDSSDESDIVEQLDDNPFPGGLTILDPNGHSKFNTDQAVLQSVVDMLRDARFVPPNRRDSLEELFKHGRRFVRKSDVREMLIYTDGVCLNNGQPNPSAGYAFFFGLEPKASGVYSNKVLSMRLETEGPTGATYNQTSNRAELRAVIAALAYRAWHGEGRNRVVIATDSEYVVSGATQWVWNWLRFGWQIVKNEPVKNRDLWELLLSEVYYLHQDCGVQVVFWRIPRVWNAVADGKAKEGAALPVQQQFITPFGNLV
ncbi:hypothetical protein B7463_g9894, partial [Scytalidium lignicola]